MILQAIDNLIIEMKDERNYVNNDIGIRSKTGDSIGYGAGLLLPGLPYFAYKRYTDDPNNPRVKSSGGRLAARFGGQLAGNFVGASIGPAGVVLGGIAGHALGSMGKSGYYCPKGFKQDPNNPDHCIKI